MGIMDRLPQRNSLVAQTADVLREAISKGQWQRWLPGEIELTRRLHVSRVTIRSALAELERERLIRAGQGRRREVICKRQIEQKRKTSRSVALLSPVPIHQLPTSTVFWMDELREHLDSAGWPLDIRESPAVYSRRPGHALEELADRNHPAGWVLFRSTLEMQRWFSERDQRAVIVGSRHEGVALPSVDVDYSAGCRHAAGRFIANGHRRLAIVRPDTKLAGDLESVAGFHSGLAQAAPSALHDNTVSGICAALDRLFSRKPAPTGLLVFHASPFLTVLGWLQRRNLRVPRDISVICRDSEPFLESVLPTPSRYTLNPKVFARMISRLVASLVIGGSTRPSLQRIMPNYVRGDTLGPAACP